MLLSLGGGIAGVLLGVLISIRASPPPSRCRRSCGRRWSSADWRSPSITGVTAGFFPAMRAANLPPIDALRSDPQARLSMSNFKAPSIAALICCVATFAFANTIITDPGPGNLGGTTANTTFGYDFTVGSSAIQRPPWESGIGNRMDLTNSHTISLWDSSGNLLATASISAGNSIH